MASVRGQVAVTPPGDDARPADVEVGDEALSIAFEGGETVTLPFVDIDDLHDDDYTLRLTDFTGRRLDLSMFGSAYGQILEDVRERRNEALQRDLLLTGVNLQDTFPGKVFGGADPMPAELRLFEDQLVVMPERGRMWGLPFSFVDAVDWDQELYQVRVRADDGTTNVFGHLAKRSEEFRDELNRLLAALAKRTAATLLSLLPGADPGALDRLAAVMRDGRAVQQRVVEAIDPALWPKLEDAVVGTADLRQTYEWLKARGPSGWPALGVKAVRGKADEGPAAPAEAEATEAAPTEAAPTASVLWFFVPFEGRNAVAQEITSEAGHATYLFRPVEPEAFAGLSGDAMAEAVAVGVARLNRALLTLNFRREPIYASDEEIATGRFSRYRVALRVLDHLRFARRQFLGRAIHNETWERQVEEAVARA